MVVREDAGTPDPVEKGFATLNTIRYVISISIYLMGENKRYSLNGRICLLRL